MTAEQKQQFERNYQYYLDNPSPSHPWILEENAKDTEERDKESRKH